MAAQEKKLFAVDGASRNPATLYRLDRDDGTVLDTIGPTGFDHLTVIDFDPTTGILYGITNGPSRRLITIDTDTGIGSVVAPITFVPPLPPPPLGNNIGHVV